MTSRVFLWNGYTSRGVTGCFIGLSASSPGAFGPRQRWPCETLAVGALIDQQR
jgi:hypothetical protein